MCDAIVNGRRGRAATSGDARTVQAFVTTDATPVDVALAELPAGGDVARILDLYAFRTWDGAAENPNIDAVASGGIAANDVEGGGGVFFLATFTAPSAYGSDGVRTSVAFVAVGTTLVLRCTGIAGVSVSWNVSWLQG